MKGDWFTREAVALLDGEDWHSIRAEYRRSVPGWHSLSGAMHWFSLLFIVVIAAYEGWRWGLLAAAAAVLSFVAGAVSARRDGYYSGYELGRERGIMKALDLTEADLKRLNDLSDPWP